MFTAALFTIARKWKELKYTSMEEWRKKMWYVLVLSHFSCVQFFVIPWTVVHQAPLSMKFSGQEYWSKLPFPSPGDLPDSGIEPGYPALQADALPSEPPGKSQGKVIICTISNHFSYLYSRRTLLQMI